MKDVRNLDDTELTELDIIMKIYSKMYSLVNIDVIIDTYDKYASPRVASNNRSYDFRFNGLIIYIVYFVCLYTNALS